MKFPWNSLFLQIFTTFHSLVIGLQTLLGQTSPMPRVKGLNARELQKMKMGVEYLVFKWQPKIEGAKSRSSFFRTVQSMQAKKDPPKIWCDSPFKETILS